MPQTLPLDVTLTDASWGLARIIRRSAPWNVDRIKLPLTTYFRSVRDGAGVDVYVIDYAIRTTHVEFGGRAEMVHGSDGLLDGHGTRVASIIGGDTCGVARGALLWGAQFNITGSDIVEALEAALSHYQGRSGTNRPAVVNCSFIIASSTVNTAVSNMIDAGMVVVAGAGNDGVDIATVTRFPAQATDAICVGAVGMADIPMYSAADDGSPRIAAFGSRVDILGPGQLARAADHTNDAGYVRSHSSSSGACAYTSGVVACMLQGKSRLTTRAQVQAVRAKLLANATTGRFRAQSQFEIGTLPDRILYLDPDIASETIEGVT